MRTEATPAEMFALELVTAVFGSTWLHALRRQGLHLGTGARHSPRLRPVSPIGLSGALFLCPCRAGAAARREVRAVLGLAKLQ